MMGYENFLVFLGSLIFWIVISAIVLAPLYYLIKTIRKKIRLHSIKTKKIKDIPEDDIDNWFPEPDPIDVDPPEENPEDERLDK